VASMWLLAAASVVAGASYQLVAPVMALIRLANQLRICCRDPEFPVGTCDGIRVRLPLSVAWVLPSIRVRAIGWTRSGARQFGFVFCAPRAEVPIGHELPP